MTGWERRAARHSALVAGVVAAAMFLGGCEDSATGFAGGMMKAIGLLLFVGLVLPAAIVGLVFAIGSKVRARRRH